MLVLVLPDRTRLLVPRRVVLRQRMKFHSSLKEEVQRREKLLRFIDSDKETCVKFAWLEEARTSYPDFSY